MTPTSDPGYLYEQLVSDMPMRMKKITVTVFYADPSNPSVPDSSRVHGGRALTLSVVVVEPTT
jgi:hypothetical protein